MTDHFQKRLKIQRQKKSNHKNIKGYFFGLGLAFFYTAHNSGRYFYFTALLVPVDFSAVSKADLVDTEKVDLVITGTHGAKGLEAFFLSTNSVTISEKVKCPVLIVPLTASYHHIKKIMYATDFQYEDLDIDILCMSAVEKKFFKKMVSKNSVKKMAFNSKIPLVSLHLSKDDRLVL